MAISAYKDQKIKSKKAAAIFGVPETTFHERLSGIKSCTETRASGHKLTEIEEKTLVKLLLDADK